MVIQQDSSDPTGVRGSNPTDRTLGRARERKANAALALALAGAEWSQIALATGYPTARAAKVAVERALEKQLDTDPNAKAKMRLMASKRLERLLMSVWPKANDAEHPEHLLANTKARELVAQWTKLHGLDAPAEVFIHNPTNDMIEEWVAKIVTHALPAVEEDDIIDLDEDSITEIDDEEAAS